MLTLPNVQLKHGKKRLENDPVPAPGAARIAHQTRHSCGGTEEGNSKSYFHQDLTSKPLLPIHPASCFFMGTTTFVGLIDSTVPGVLIKPRMLINQDTTVKD